MGGSLGAVAVKLGSVLGPRRRRSLPTPAVPGNGHLLRSVRTGAWGISDLFGSERREERPSLGASLTRLAIWMVAAVALTSAVLYLLGSVAIRAALELAA